MDTRRLMFLHELSVLGSMRAVADVTGTSTSTVSQQIALLAHEMGTELVVPDGRGVRLTPAGARLAEHAATILASVRRARLDLDPTAEPNGTVRIAGYAGAIRSAVLPVIRELAHTHPRVRVEVHEHQPREALSLLAADEIDLALTYDYDLAPLTPQPALHSTELWTTAWGLGVPDDERAARARLLDRPIAEYRGATWIGNSRNTADEDALRILASIEGFEMRITHAADQLGLVQDLILAGMGVALFPEDRPLFPGVTRLPLTSPGVTLRAYLQLREGRDSWPALALIRDRILLRASEAERPAEEPRRE